MDAGPSVGSVCCLYMLCCNGMNFHDVKRWIRLLSLRHSPVTHSLIVAIIHPPIYPTRPPVCLTIVLSLSSFTSPSRQDHNDSTCPLPASCSTFYYPIEPDAVSAASSCPAGAQPSAGAASPGELPGSPAVETEWRPVCLEASPLSALPPVPAGGGPASRVTEELCKQHREVTRQSLVSGEGAREVLNSRAADCSDLEMTLIWWLWTQLMCPSNVFDMCVFYSSLVPGWKFPRNKISAELNARIYVVTWQVCVCCWICDS